VAKPLAVPELDRDEAFVATPSLRSQRIATMSPWRLALIEERAGELAAAAAAAAEASSETASGGRGAHFASEQAAVSVAAARHRRSPMTVQQRIGEPLPGQWSQLETMRRWVETGEGDQSDRPSVQGGLHLPKPGYFPQSYAQTTEFVSPAAVGARRRWEPSTLEAPLSMSRRASDSQPFNAAASATLMDTGWQDMTSPLAEAGWTSSSLRQLSSCHSRFPAACAVSASESLPNLHADTRSEDPALELPVLSRPELLRRCWTKSRALIRSTRDAFEQGPVVK